MDIKGVLLCGGNGTRLRPLTEVVNKHLVRIGNMPMAEYPLRSMIESGIKEILIVSGGDNFAGVVKYFGSGSKWGIHIYHAIQDKAGGIAEALSLAEKFVGKDKVLVCLGDGIFNMRLKSSLECFKESKDNSAYLFSIKCENLKEYGVFKFDKNGILCDVIEKPNNPPSKFAQTGIFLYGPEVFKIIKTLKPSKRGELEITDVNRKYIKKNKVLLIPMEGWWTDCGSIKNILAVEDLLKK